MPHIQAHNNLVEKILFVIFDDFLYFLKLYRYSPFLYIDFIIYFIVISDILNQFSQHDMALATHSTLEMWLKNEMWDRKWFFLIFFNLFIRNVGQ